MTQEPASHTAAVRTEPAADRDVVLDVLFRAQYAALLRLALVLIGSREEAEEVVQDAFVSLHRHWSGLRDTGSAGAYLRAVDAGTGGAGSPRRSLRAEAGAVP